MNVYCLIVLQGVNSALEDVVELDRALGDSKDDLALGLALFEERRMPDVEALVRLMQFGAPYQVWQSTVAGASLSH